jgi:polar amino acid transport system substrate-binding protein
MNLHDKPTPLSSEARAELAPTGPLRVGIAVGAAGSALWATRDEKSGVPRGVTVEIGKAMAEWFGLDLALVEHASSGAIIEAADSNIWDVAFTPVDAERKRRVDFGTNYFLGESTYLVHADSPITTIADVDAEGVKVFGVENTATLRSARRTLGKAEVHGLERLDAAIEAFKSGEADALALGRESLKSLLPVLPPARVLDGNFHAAGTAVLVPRGHPLALDAVTEFIERKKADGWRRPDRGHDGHCMSSCF